MKTRWICKWQWLWNYTGGKISLSKAARIAGVMTIEFKDILAKNGFIREIESAPVKEMDKKLKNYL